MLIINSAQDLVTKHEQTRAGFVAFALEKNRRSEPLIQQAKSFQSLASKAHTPEELLDIPEIRSALLTAAGLSDKALNHFSEEDKNVAIQQLIDKFLKPAGDKFIEEAVYRFLLIKGDSLGGQMRNIVGALAQKRLVDTMVSNLQVKGTSYEWFRENKKCSKLNAWLPGIADGLSIPDQGESLRALHWENEKGSRILFFNLNVPLVKKNVDFCLFDCDKESFGKKKTIKNANAYIMLGELKGGIDPAGADEHWKTAKTALERIRNSFKANGQQDILTSFIGAAIEPNMAKEIFDDLQTGKLSNVANLTVDEQLISFCSWVLEL